MNQILYTGGKKKLRGGPADIKTIIRFFCISIIIFGVILLGEGVYGVAVNMNAKNAPEVKTPEIYILRQANELNITITHEKPIAKLVYHWNNEQNQVIMGDGTAYLEKTIKLPLGSNTLHLAVTDNEGIETIYKKEYYIQSDLDITNPLVEFATQGNNLTIKATDDKELLRITYKWDDQSETEVSATDDNKTTIETTISIPLGEHKITVTAVDSSNNTQTKSFTCTGATKPKIIVTQDGGNLIIEATNEQGIKSVEFTINGQTYLIVEDFYTDDTKTTIKYVQAMVPGENRISVKAVSSLSDLVVETFEGIGTYIP